MSSSTIRTREDGPVMHLQLHRPEANNTINAQMIRECREAVARCEQFHVVLVLEGLPEVFCFGADFKGMRDDLGGAGAGDSSADELYGLWQQLASGSFVVVAHVRGQANAGGVGFVAASDIVIADAAARFSLSELLFGLYPACVMPFLVRRIGWQRANFMALSTQTVTVEQALGWGLVDAWHAHSDTLLQRQLHRLRRLPKASVGQYKQYMRQLPQGLAEARPLAVRNNHDMHRLPGVMEGIVRYVETGRFPWDVN